jgi:hypothetical protein
MKRFLSRPIFKGLQVRISFLITLCLLLLAACGPSPIAAPTPTITSTPAPTAASTAIPTSTEIPLSAHMPSDFYTAFNAIPDVGPVEGFFRVENDQLFITVGDQSIEISQDGQFGVNVDSSGRLINNPLASLSVVGEDGNTYGFNPETKSWFNTAEFQGSEDINNPTIVEAMRVFDGTLTRALLLNPDVNMPFPENTLFEGNVVNVHDAGASDGGYFVYLDSLSIDNPSFSLNTMDIRLINQYFRIIVPSGTVLNDGTITDRDYSYDFQPQQRMNSVDLNNPDTSQTSIIYVARGESRSTPQRNHEYQNMISSGSYPFPILSCTGGYLRGNIPDLMGPDYSLSILLNLPGNSVDQMGYFDQNIDNAVSLRNPQNDVGFPTVEGIPSALQKMIFPSYMFDYLNNNLFFCYP